MIGKRVIVTSAGELLTVRLTGARRIWCWTGAGSCSGLAAHGPKSGKITPPVSAIVAGACEVLEMTPLAVTAVEAVPPWMP